MNFCPPIIAVLAAISITANAVDWSNAASPVLIWFADKLLPAVLLAILISWFIPRAMERYRGRRDQLYKLTDTLREQIQAYQKAATAYWLSPQTSASALKAEIDLDFLAKDIGVLMQLMSAMGVQGLWGNPEAAGVGAVSDLVAATTSHERIARTRKPDPSRVAAINDCAVHLTSLILQKRWEVLKGQ